MFPYFGTFLLISAMVFTMALYTTRLRRSEIHSNPKSLVGDTATTEITFVDISDAVCDCLAVGQCGTSDKVNSLTKYCGTDEEVEGKLKICCPIVFGNTNENEISNRFDSERDIAPTNLEEIYGSQTEPTETTVQPINDDDENAIANRALVAPSLQNSSENQISLKAHRNFKRLPNWKECGLPPVNSGIRKPRIVGGESVEEREFPWIVRLGFSHKIGVTDSTLYKCAGTILNQRYIISAAHCISNFGTPTEILAQSSMGKNISFTADKVFVHPGFNKTNKNNDIVLIRLSHNLVGGNATNRTTRLVPVCLPFFSEYGVDAASLLKNSDYVLGWGTRSTNSTKLSENLIKLIVPTMPNEMCTKMFGNYFLLKDTQICAGGNVGEDTCQGDSGGPLATSYDSPTFSMGPIHVQLGITSFGSKICAKGVPGIYTRLSEYLPWILDTIEV